MDLKNVSEKNIRMDDDNSNDVVLIENTEDKDSKPSGSGSDSRPLMMLFLRLISNDTKSNTVLTNAQILSILNQEFNMDVIKLHELEKDIYINIVKKFLKDWPQWDIFDQVINKLKKKAAENEIKDILEEKYKHLKDYLQSIIETATPLAKETVKKLKPNETEKTFNAEDNNIVLEIYCTRKMLNQFIYNQPNPAENNSLFHLMNYTPYNMNVTAPHYSFTSLLHWYGVNLSIHFQNFQFIRYTNHKLNHVLVNEALGPRKLNNELDTDIYISSNNFTKSVCIASITDQLDKILQHYCDKIEYKMLEEIFNVIKSDMDLKSVTLDVSTDYKRRLNKYPYVRKLYKEVKGVSHHNIFIEETITPIQSWQVVKFVDTTITIPNLQSWLRFDCNDCQKKFHGANFLTSLREHFKTFHMDEPDWSCTNCERVFKITEITELGWKHECVSNHDY